MSKLSSDKIFFLQLVVIVLSVALAVYGIVTLLVGINVVLGKSNVCEWKNGEVRYDNQGRTGNRWEPNPLTMGLTGKCYVPGTKGVTE